MPRFVRFILVGALGFFVDSGVLYLAIYIFSANPYVGRLISYLGAVTFTWYMNRAITFPDARGDNWVREWLKFMAYNSVGGAVNYSVYLCYLHYAGNAMIAPVVGVALGSFSGLIVNYTLSRYLVFVQTPVEPAQKLPRVS